MTRPRDEDGSREHTEERAEASPRCGRGGEGRGSSGSSLGAQARHARRRGAAGGGAAGGGGRVVVRDRVVGGVVGSDAGGGAQPPAPAGQAGAVAGEALASVEREPG